MTLTTARSKQHFIALAFCALFISGCSDSNVSSVLGQSNIERWDNDGDGVSNPATLIADTEPENIIAQKIVRASLEILPIKTFRISWQSSVDAHFYRILENPDGISGYSQISKDLDASTQSFDHQVALYNRVNARYIVQACNTNECVDSDPLMVTGSLDKAIGYFKASNPSKEDRFGNVSLSADGNVLAVGASDEDGGATGINGDQSSNSALNSGAVYVFIRSNGFWQQHAYLKASNADGHAPNNVNGNWAGGGDGFGRSVSLSANGNILAVGAPFEYSAASGINGDQQDNSAYQAGAVYVFRRSNGLWHQQDYLKASNTEQRDRFGSNVFLSADGNTLAASAPGENGASAGINGDQSDNSKFAAGAVYVFVHSQGIWQQEAYIKASNPGSLDHFGGALSLSANGNTLAVGVAGEDSSGIGINGDQTNNLVHASGAVYVFVRSHGIWQQEAYIKASNAARSNLFGVSVSLSADGNTLAVGAAFRAQCTGAAYVFVRDNGIWQQQAFILASNGKLNDFFGWSVSLSADGNTLAIGAKGESSSGVDGAGAAYVFARSDGLWQEQTLLKAGNPGNNDNFGWHISLSADGNTLAVNALVEDSASVGINGDQTDDSFESSGAVYLF